MLGPFSFLTAWLLTTDSGYRHSFQALVSIGHIYSNLLYFATSLYDDYILGKQYYRPEPFYFWAYFVGMNAIWLVIPGSEWPQNGNILISRSFWYDFVVLLYSSMRTTAKAFTEIKGTRRKVKDLYDSMKDARTRVKPNAVERKEL